MRRDTPLLAALAILLTPSPATAAASPVTLHARKAVAYATSRHITSSIAVIDTVTGRVWTAGSTKRTYAAASTAKVLVAVTVLARHKMTKKNRRDMWAMITRSDNDAWHRLGRQVGGAKALLAVEHRYHVNIGRLPRIRSNWGVTQVTALGMARMYAAMKHDKTVWPWLSNAMRHMAKRSAGGDDQRFGIPAARPRGGYALKQGWLVVRSDGRPYAVMNSTGYVDHERYVVCLYTRGKPSTYKGVKNGYLGKTVSGEAKRLLPYGRIA